jgi:hypothetical protein
MDWPAFLKRHESLVSCEGLQSSFGASSDRLVSQASVGLDRILKRPNFPDFVFAFHDRDEIGARMLARIAKHTGLTPEDL